MWKGTLSPYVRKADIAKSTTHTSRPEFEVTEVVDGFARVVVYFNHECNHNGKHSTPPSNSTGYEYEIEVPGDMDETDIKNNLESQLGNDYSTSDLIDLLEGS